MITKANIKSTTRNLIAGLTALAIATLGTIPAEATPALMPFADTEAYDLTNEQWEVLGQVQQQCYEVTCGVRTSTVFEIDAGKILGQYEWSSDDLGYEPVKVIDYGAYSETGLVASFAGEKDWAVDYELKKILTVLRLKCPSITEWYDFYGWGTAKIVWNKENRDGKWYASIASATFSCPVRKEFEASEYEVSQDAVRRIQESLERAQAIANAHAGEPAMARIRSYCDELYSWSTLATGYHYATSTMPWGFTSVFDGDPSTGSVCEGYSKAFSLLMELSGQHDAECRMVMGNIVSYKGDTRHMWCVIKMPDGRNYLTDIANNQSGSVADGMALIVPASGSVDEGYTIPAQYGYQLSYRYEEDTLEAYRHEAIAISDTPYVDAQPYAPESVDASEHTYVEEAETYEAPVVVLPGEAPTQQDTQEYVPLTIPVAEKNYLIPEIDEGTADAPDCEWFLPALIVLTAATFAVFTILSVVFARRRNARRSKAYANRVQQTPSR